MTYDASFFQGPLRILDGHPVPFSGTCQRERADGGGLASVPAIHFLTDIEDFLRRHRPGQHLLRVEGDYFFYSPVANPQSAIPHPQ